jgi:hypothetical protein
VFPATRFYRYEVTGQKRRHHFHETALQRAVHLAGLEAGLAHANANSPQRKLNEGYAVKVPGVAGTACTTDDDCSCGLACETQVWFQPTNSYSECGGLRLRRPRLGYRTIMRCATVSFVGPGETCGG